MPTRFRSVIIAILLLSAIVSAPAADVGIYHDDAAARREAGDIFRGTGLTAAELDPAALAALAPRSLPLLVIAPGACVPSAARPAIEDFLSSGGHLIDLSPGAFADPLVPAALYPSADFGDPATFEIIRPERGRQVEEVVDAPGEGRAIELYTKRIIDGPYMVSFPLGKLRRPDLHLLRLDARGDNQVTIVRLQLRDDAGRRWVNFIEAGREWKSHTLALADFLPLDPTSGTTTTGPDPLRLTELRVGIEPVILWGEKPGSFALANVAFATAAEPPAGPTSRLLPWRECAEILKAKFPRGVLDPFAGAGAPFGGAEMRSSGQGVFLTPMMIDRPAQAVAIPEPPARIGRFTAELPDLVERHGVRRIPLLTAASPTSPSVTVAELRLPTRAGRGAVALYGVDAGAYSDPNIRRAVAETTRFLIGSPRIVEVVPNTSKAESGNATLTCRVRVANPRREAVDATIELVAGPLRARAERRLSLGSTDITLDLGTVPADFPLAHFEWSVELHAAGKLADRWSDSFDAESAMLDAAERLLAFQQGHDDGRFSQHFFADAYGARALLAAGRYFSRPDVAARHADRLRATPPEAMTAAALRFFDMVAERQLPTGAIPMGYSEDLEIYFIADGGSIALGMVQAASWLDGPRRERYLDTVRRYLRLRATFRQDERVVAQLKAKHGEHPDIGAGLYGLGFMGRDFYEGGPWWPEGRREMRGPQWVLGLSMPAIPGLARETGERRYADLAESDGSFFARSAFKWTDHFISEAMFWMFLYLEKNETREEFGRLLRRVLPDAMNNGREHDMLGRGGRTILSWLSFAYSRRLLGDTPATRAAMVKGLWETGSPSLPYSFMRVADLLPGGRTTTHTNAAHYLNFSAIVLIELLDPGATLLRGQGPPSR